MKKKIFSFKKFVKDFYGVTKNYDNLYDALKEGRYWAAIRDGEEVTDNSDLIIYDEWCEVVEDEN